MVAKSLHMHTQIIARPCIHHRSQSRQFHMCEVLQHCADMCSAQLDMCISCEGSLCVFFTIGITVALYWLLTHIIRHALYWILEGNSHFSRAIYRNGACCQVFEGCLRTLKMCIYFVIYRIALSKKPFGPICLIMEYAVVLKH